MRGEKLPAFLTHFPHGRAKCQVRHVVAGFSPRSTSNSLFPSWGRTRAKARATYLIINQCEAGVPHSGPRFAGLFG
jgi:hypothetical protein